MLNTPFVGDLGMLSSALSIYSRTFAPFEKEVGIIADNSCCGIKMLSGRELVESVIEHGRKDAVVKWPDEKVQYHNRILHP